MAPPTQENMNGEDHTTTVRVICPQDLVIAVMGMTGAGKSTFISLCTQNPAIVVSHGLNSCTSRVSVHTTEHFGRTIHLIDTPGFDDTERSDVDTLHEIAYWLSAAYENGIRISGLIYLHRVTNTRLQGAAFRSLNVFKRICGSENYCGIILATTRWDELKPEQIGLASSRHRDLCENNQYWGDILEAGGRAVALSAARIDAMKILEHIVGKERKMTLAFQKQMSEELRPIRETDAGKFLSLIPDAFYRDMDPQIEEDMNSLENNLSLAPSQHQGRLNEVESELSKLHMTSEDLKVLWEQNIQANLEKTREESTMSEEQYERLKNQVKFARATLPVDDRVHAVQRYLSATGPLPSISDASPTVNSFPTIPGAVRGRSEEILVVKQERIATTYRRSKLTAFSVVGTGLAAAQLVAAIACTVM
ncbi:P-loop containing nucleoside triphosphate hydrolase protein [Clohesyomyces aquaticus]|uniref:p-loop containing nucleoside triphosphate hydrolase protein n=1 Tax=Clohesyomyces aquaticus TaxID=1231657 RepID=A0A1Y1YI59_9PLEO|nr:P-loop containing nucleoside triphosphate hydrolase protein [Clohesyomyces aquaticus]